MTWRRCASDLRRQATRTPLRRMTIPTANVSISMTPRATTGSLFSTYPVIRLNATITSCRIDNAMIATRVFLALCGYCCKIALALIDLRYPKSRIYQNEQDPGGRLPGLMFVFGDAVSLLFCPIC